MKTQNTYWLRSETKKNEFRRALTPDSCQELIAAGHKVVVEDWPESIIPIDEYQKVGCTVTQPGSWVDSPKDTIVVGLKALPDDIDQFVHRHVFFAHVYKEQDGWKEILTKFQKGGGSIIDLEFMVDDKGRRVCAFGYWAGYVGAALGALFSKANHLETAVSELGQKMRFPEKKDLIDFVKSHSEINSPEAIVIGCMGRSGQGAMDCLNELSWSATGWDKDDTQSGGPFREILNYDLFVNCVLSMHKMPPFITQECLQNNPHKLNMISDVSCDPDSECNMVPLYDKATLIHDPLHDVKHGEDWVGLVAIDNLPSILPKESSFDFSSQLCPHLKNLEEDNIPVSNALKSFISAMDNL